MRLAAEYIITIAVVVVIVVVVLRFVHVVAVSAGVLVRKMVVYVSLLNEY